jgi:hypothetical protein
MSKKQYDIGYKKPPVRTRFKKGQSGNPKGRPKGKVTIADADAVFDQVLSAHLPVSQNGRSHKMSKLEAMFTQTVNQSLKGHHPSTRLVFAHLARRVPQTESDAPAAGKTDEEAKNEFLAYFKEMGANLSADKTTTSASNDGPVDDTPKPESEDGGSD